MTETKQKIEPQPSTWFRKIVTGGSLTKASQLILAVLLAAQAAAAAPAAAGHKTTAERPPSPFSTAPERVKAPNIALPSLGKLATRHAKEIASSSWSVGGETLDRDFTVYENYKTYLGPLGAKGIRLQAGWAKCEKTPGVYDWAWLDAVVNDALAQGVQPWLETSYGNPAYEGGGGASLGAGFPTSDAALAGWDKWVRTLARRYKDRVREWEIWNEPDLSKGNTPEDYTKLFIRTATIIREEQPGARIYALALAKDFGFAEAFLKLLKQAGKTDLMDAVTFHGYPRNPDDTSQADKVRALLAQYAPKAEARRARPGRRQSGSRSLRSRRSSGRRTRRRNGTCAGCSRITRKTCRSICSRLWICTTSEAR